MRDRDRILVAEISDLLFEWNPKNALKLQFVVFICSFFGHCHVVNPLKEILFLFGWCYITFPNMEPLTFFDRFVEKSCNILFFRFVCSENDSTVKWQLYCYKWYPAFEKNFFQKTFLLDLQTHLENILWVNYNVLPTTMTRSASCPIVDIALYWWETFECCYRKLYTVCIHISNTISVRNWLSRVDNSLIMGPGQFILTAKTEESTECPSSPKIDSWGKSRKKNIRWAPSIKLNRRKLLDQSSQTALNKLKSLNLSLNWWKL